MTGVLQKRILAIFKARAKCLCVTHTGRASNAENRKNPHGPKGWVENGPAPALLLSHVSQRICSFVAPWRRAILNPTKHQSFARHSTGCSGRGHRDPRSTAAPQAFTLIELLVVVAIIAVLAALLVPAAQRMIGGGTETKCLSNLRQISTAMITWAADHDGKLPPQTDSSSGLQWNNPGGPFFEFMLNKAGIADNWDELVNTVLRCPGSNAKGTADGERDNSYGRNSHLGVADYAVTDMQYFETPLARIQFPSRAALVADWPLPNFQRYTLTSQARKDNLWGRHDGRMNVAYVDGHVGPITRQQWDAWTAAGGGSQEQKDFRLFLTGLERNNPNF